MKGISMSLNKIRQRLYSSEFEIIIEDRLPNDLGTKIVTAQGHVVVVYDSGVAVIQGKNQEQMRRILGRGGHMRI
jgi:hypothetical protein